MPAIDHVLQTDRQSPHRRGSGHTGRAACRAVGLLPTGIFLLAAFLTTLLVTPQSARAQVILNTERFQMAEVEGFHLNADLSGSVQRGNRKILNVSSSGIVGYSHSRHWPRVIFGGRFLRDDTRSILDQQYIQLRYSYLLTPRAQTFHFVQAQKNETLLLRSRWLVGSGLRWTFAETDQLLVAAGTGVMREWERLDPERVGPDDAVELDALRMANLGVLRWTFAGGARLVNITYVQPDLGRFSDLRLLNDLGLSAPVTDWARLTGSLEWRRDTRPPSTLERDDLTIRLGLSLDIG
ncbi:MAG: DUF481 domain-containing protein [Gemmatimonadales bacterium]|nr:MAG: DUF481 domain-containing protein [Gemmatimonadales bacterium]